MGEMVGMDPAGVEDLITRLAGVEMSCQDHDAWVTALYGDLARDTGVELPHPARLALQDAAEVIRRLAADLRHRLDCLRVAEEDGRAPPAGGGRVEFEAVFADLDRARAAGRRDAAELRRRVEDVDGAGGSERCRRIEEAVRRAGLLACDPAYAAAFVNHLGPDGVEELMMAWEEGGPCTAALITVAGELATVVAHASRTGRLDRRVHDPIFSADNPRLGALVAGAGVPFGVEAKQRIFEVALSRDERPDRRALLAFVAADPDLAQQWAMGVYFGGHPALVATAEAFEILAAASAATADRERDYAEAALEATVVRVAQGMELTDDARRGLAFAISSQPHRRLRRVHPPEF